MSSVRRDYNNGRHVKNVPIPVLPPDADETSRRSAFLRWPAALLLVTALAVQIVLPLLDWKLIPSPTASLWMLQSTPELLSWMREWLIAQLLDNSRFLLLGLLVPLAFRPSESWLGSLGRALLAMMAVAVIRAAEAGGIPTPLSLLLSLPAGLLGCWIGLRWVQGGSARKWLVPQLLLLLLLVAGGLGWFLFAALETQPMKIDAARVTAEEKRRVFKLLKDSDSVGEGREKVRTVHLSAKDVNVLLAWAMKLNDKERKAAVGFGDRTVDTRASLAIPWPGGEKKYLNLANESLLEIEDGRLEFKIERLQFGSFRAPDFVCRGLTWLIRSSAERDPDVVAALRTVKKLRISPEKVEISDRVEDLKSGVIARLLRRFGEKPNVIAAVEDHIQHLLKTADSLPAAGDDRFLALMRAAFSHARDRSAGRDPVAENRAAILALAVLAGHPRFETLIGIDKLPANARRRIGKVSIRGRNDWPKHFLVSAGVALLSNAATSNAVGLMKEELDRAKGGSGFSFPDLLADRAGVRFAKAAVRDKAAAVQIQKRIANDLKFDDFFPPAADLPEGLSDAEFKARYGQVGSPAYDRQLKQIDRRLEQAPLLR